MESTLAMILNSLFAANARIAELTRELEALRAERDAVRPDPPEPPE